MSLYARIAAALVLLGVLYAAYWSIDRRAYIRGANEVKVEWQAEKLAAEAQAENNRLLRQAAINRPAERFAEQVAKDRVITRTIIKEVEKYVPNSIAMLPSGFRLYHDAAAAGEAPADPSGVDAAPVSPQSIAVTIAENYADSNYDKERLAALQAIIRASECFDVPP